MDDFIKIIADEIEYYQINNRLNDKLVPNVVALVEESNKKNIESTTTS